MLIGRGGESDVASGCRALRKHSRLLAITKFDFSDVEKAIIHGFARN